MKRAHVLAIGVAVGVLDGAGIFFAPDGPYPVEIFVAATLKGVLVALLIGFTLRRGATWLRGAGIGLLYGFVFALVVFLTKGGLRSMDAPFVVPFGLFFGGVTGVLIAKFGLRSAKVGIR